VAGASGFRPFLKEIGDQGTASFQSRYP